MLISYCCSCCFFVKFRLSLWFHITWIWCAHMQLLSRCRTFKRISTVLASMPMLRPPMWLLLLFLFSLLLSLYCWWFFCHGNCFNEKNREWEQSEHRNINIHFAICVHTFIYLSLSFSLSVWVEFECAACFSIHFMFCCKAVVQLIS